MTETTSELRRYTSFASLLSILQQSAIALLPTYGWEDGNDKNLIKAYADHKGSKTCLTLCFAQTRENYHHWKVFASGHDGVCIVFDKSRLIEYFNSAFSSDQIRHNKMDYLSLDALKINKPLLNDFPFSKRLGYMDEKEYRVLFESKEEEKGGVSMAIELNVIKRILINPWVPEPLWDAMKKAIQAIEGCKNIRVTKSRLTEAHQWTALTKKNRL